MEIVYYAACSLDGFIATADGGVDWLTPFQNGGEDYGFADFNRSVDALIMGSRTYEFALAHPPWMAPDQPSWVFTRRDLPRAHPSVSLTADDPATVAAAMEAAGHRRAWLLGGGELAASFEAAGLITDYVISIVPVLLGAGVPLFAGAAAGHPTPHALELVATERYAGGIVQLTYREAPEGEGA